MKPWCFYLPPLKFPQTQRGLNLLHPSCPSFFLPFLFCPQPSTAAALSRPASLQPSPCKTNQPPFRPLACLPTQFPHCYQCSQDLKSDDDSLPLKNSSMTLHSLKTQIPPGPSWTDPFTSLDAVPTIPPKAHHCSVPRVTNSEWVILEQMLLLVHPKAKHVLPYLNLLSSNLSFSPQPSTSTPKLLLWHHVL